MKTKQCRIGAISIMVIMVVFLSMSGINMDASAPTTERVYYVNEGFEYSDLDELMETSWTLQYAEEITAEVSNDTFSMYGYNPSSLRSQGTLNQYFSDMETASIEDELFYEARLFFNSEYYCDTNGRVAIQTVEAYGQYDNWYTLSFAKVNSTDVSLTVTGYVYDDEGVISGSHTTPLNGTIPMDTWITVSIVMPSDDNVSYLSISNSTDELNNMTFPFYHIDPIHTTSILSFDWGIDVDYVRLYYLSPIGDTTSDTDDDDDDDDDDVIATTGDDDDTWGFYSWTFSIFGGLAMASWLGVTGKVEGLKGLGFIDSKWFIKYGMVIGVGLIALAIVQYINPIL